MTSPAHKIISFISLALLTALLLISASSSAQEMPLGYTVTGRVVDERGRPVAGAGVGLRVPDPQSPDAFSIWTTDADGRFRARDSSRRPTDKATLYVQAPPKDTHVPVDAMFGRLRYLGASLAGQGIDFGGRQEVDVGDVRAQVRYGLVRLRLLDKEGAPLAPDAKEWANLLLRVHDARGDIVADGGVSDAGKRREESLVVLALPEGRWQIEASVFGESFGWQAAGDELVVRAVDEPLEASVRLSGDSCDDQASDAAGKSLTAEDASRELGRLGIAYDEETFVERAGRSNLKAVRLFLAAGVNVDARGRDGRTALMRASGPGFGYASVLCALLDAGADVNARDREGQTALIHATHQVNSQILQLLIDGGADVNAQNNRGWTPLMFAAQSGQANNVEVLLNAGADTSARNGDGKTALDVAFRQAGNRVVPLLEKAAAQGKRNKPSVP